MNIQAMALKDGYKTNHRIQYPEGTEVVYSNLTARSDRHANGADGEGVVVFGISGFCQEWLINYFNNNFFNKVKGVAVARYSRLMDAYLGKDTVSVDHIAELHDLGYLPVTIRSLPEGSMCPIGVPMLTIVNTRTRFFWVTNFLETLISCELWQPITSATTARLYKKIMTKWAKKTGAPLDFIPFQGHDFSFRGMAGVHSAAKSGAGHLTSFVGTDTIPAIEWLEDNNYANIEGELVGCSVSATEHSVMCMGGKEDEIETFRRLIHKVQPTGIMSIVSDTWDFWKVVTEYLPILKDEIMARDGKVVIRPDSGDPVDIICGNPKGQTPAEVKGLVESLFHTFGGTINHKGFKVLDEHIGAIYGDAITLERCEEILKRLAAKGFASCNIVFGIGSYTYQMVTRDTYGMAVKATWGSVDGESREIFKDPKTDSGTKKSAKGLLRVDMEDGKYVLTDQCSMGEHAAGELTTVFSDGELLVSPRLSDIRERVNRTIEGV